MNSPVPPESSGEAKCRVCGAMIQARARSCTVCHENFERAFERRKRNLNWNNLNVDIRVPEAQEENPLHLGYGVLALLAMLLPAIALFLNREYFGLLILLAIVLGPPHIRMAVLLSRKRAMGMPIPAGEWLMVLLASVGAFSIVLFAAGIAFFAVCSVLGLGMLASGSQRIEVLVGISSTAALAVAIPTLIRFFRSGS